jgi:hypothetical protein
MIWSIKGVPLITQTKLFTKYLSGLNLDIEPKATSNPRGIAAANVTPNIKRV